MSHEASFGQRLELSTVCNKAIASAAKKHNRDSDWIQENVFKRSWDIFNFFDNLFADRLETKSEAILSFISGGENLLLEACNGNRFIGGEKNLFKSWIDPDYKNWNLNKKGQPTLETPVSVYEIVNDAKFVFAEIFGSLTLDTDKLCLTQNQIVRFCEKYPTWFRHGGYATFFLFFLFKENREFFVAHVYVDSDGLLVYVYRLEDVNPWHGSYRHRVVVPQLVS